MQKELIIIYIMMLREELNFCGEEFLEEESTQLDVLLKLCNDPDEQGIDSERSGLGFSEEDKFGELISCPICGADISGVTDDMRQAHTNGCLDKMGDSNDELCIIGVSALGPRKKNYPRS